MSQKQPSQEVSAGGANKDHKNEAFHSLLFDIFIWGPKNPMDNQNIWDSLKYKFCSGFGSKSEKDTQEALNSLKSA